MAGKKVVDWIALILAIVGGLTSEFLLYTPSVSESATGSRRAKPEEEVFLLPKP